MCLWLPNESLMFFPCFWLALTSITPTAPEVWEGGRGCAQHLPELFKCSIHRGFYYTSNNLAIVSEKLEIVKYAEEHRFSTHECL